MPLLATINVQKIIGGVGTVTASGVYELAVIDGGLDPDYYKHSATGSPTFLPNVLWRPHWNGSTETRIKIDAWYEGTGPYEIFLKDSAGIWVVSFTDGDNGGEGTVVITGAPITPDKPTTPGPSHQGVDIRLGWPQLTWQAVLPTISSSNFNSR